jgi:uncharacterized membrane protein (UPF0127 family)
VIRRIALALIVAGAIGIAVAIAWIVRDDGGNGGATAPATTSGTALHFATTPASAPFAGLTETRLEVGGRCLRAVVADSEAERVEGLRQRSDLGPYDAMLFVFPEPTITSFTMSTVPVPLDIGFYAADGLPVSRLRMKPCPHAEADCPGYHATGAFTLALETLGGKLPSGALSGCN